LGEILIPTCSVTVKDVLPYFVVSATEVAVTVTNGGLGAAAGAVYRPDAVMTPQAEPMQPTPLNAQVTDLLLDPVTVAVNCCCPPTPTEGLPGETLTLTFVGEPIATVVEPEMAPFESEVAVTVTVFGLGAVAGAV
jgi:hypothetical protein